MPSILDRNTKMIPWQVKQNRQTNKQTPPVWYWLTNNLLPVCTISTASLSKTSYPRNPDRAFYQASSIHTTCSFQPHTKQAVSFLALLVPWTLPQNTPGKTHLGHLTLIQRATTAHSPRHHTASATQPKPSPRAHHMPSNAWGHSRASPSFEHKVRLPFPSWFVQP